jgi:ectoine hydroxylase-related dioxygenase (phytanoyl-CoA dioxygenase family)
MSSELRQPTVLDDYLFDLRGYLILENVIEPELLDELNAEFDQFPRDLPLGGWYKGAQRRDYNSATGMELHHCLEIGGPFEKLVDHPSWLGYVQKYCGEQHSYVEGLFIDECMTSQRNSGGHHPLHSGRYHGALRGRYEYDNGVFRCGQVNILMALTDVGPGDGATMIIPGSHKSNLPLPVAAEHHYGGAKADQLPPGAIEAHLKKGDALLFVDGITHGGVGRTNPGERRVIIYRYGPSWGRTRFGYEYSEELLKRLTPRRRRILEPVPKCYPGADWIPVEAPVVARRAEEAQSA